MKVCCLRASADMSVVGTCQLQGLQQLQLQHSTGRILRPAVGVQTRLHAWLYTRACALVRSLLSCGNVARLVDSLPKAW
jgi:hypothetical protein